jgi:drug/metabolite transporter (DMT)-like permease
MDALTFFVVLACALTHALTNCFIKNQSDPAAGALLLAVGSGVAALPLLLIAGLPPLSALPYMAGSVVFGLVHWIFLGRAYENGDVSLVVPVASGVAPAFVMASSWVLIGDAPTPRQFAVLLLVMVGTAMVAWSAVDTRAAARNAIASSVVVALAAASYTLLDALGARAVGDPLAYGALLHVWDAVNVYCFAMFFRRKRIVAAFKIGWLPALVAGAAALAMYTALLWAMTRAPIPLVAALRESSVFFAALIAVMWLREPLRTWRLAGAGAVATGVAFLKFA